MFEAREVREGGGWRNSAGRELRGGGRVRGEACRPGMGGHDHIPLGGKADRTTWRPTAGFPARMGRHPAQRASRSPSQGRRPWGGSPPPPRSAQRANRSSNRAGHEKNGWPVGPAHVVGPVSRPAGPGWGNGWPFGPLGRLCVPNHRGPAMRTLVSIAIGTDRGWVAIMPEFPRRVHCRSIAESAPRGADKPEGSSPRPFFETTVPPTGSGGTRVCSPQAVRSRHVVPEGVQEGRRGFRNAVPPERDPKSDQNPERVSRRR